MVSSLALQVALLLFAAPSEPAATAEPPAPAPPAVRGPESPTLKIPDLHPPDASGQPVQPATPMVPAAGRTEPPPAHPRGAGATLPVREPVRGPTTPPSLTSKALADELRRSAANRQSDREALAAERARLDKQQKEIADARAALKVETDRLQALLKAAGDVPGGKGGVAPLDALAKTLKGMKAEPAALLLAQLDRPLAAALLQRMKPADAATVMEKMDPTTGAALVAMLAVRKGGR